MSKKRISLDGGLKGPPFASSFFNPKTASDTADLCLAQIGIGFSGAVYGVLRAISQEAVAEFGQSFNVSRLSDKVWVGKPLETIN